MKPITKLYIRAFLQMGGTYGLMMLIFDWTRGDGVNIWRFLFLTFFFGITMSVLLVSYHKERLKAMGIKELTDDNLKVKHQKEIISRLSKQEFIDQLKKDKILGKMKLTPIKNGIKLSSKTTWRLWGEIIKVIISNNSQDDYKYQVICRPKLKTMIVDNGRNLKNINSIQKILTTATPTV